MDMKQVLLSFLMLVVMQSACFAATHEWTSPKANLKIIKTILVVDPEVEPGKVQDPFAIQKVQEYIEEIVQKNQFDKTARIRLIRPEEFAKKLNYLAGTDVFELGKTDQKQAGMLMAEHVPNIIDAILYTKIIEMGYGKGTSSGFTMPIQGTKTSYVSGNVNGQNVSGYIQTPKTDYINVPGGPVDIVHGGVFSQMVDIKTFSPIWGRVDIRDRENAPLNKTTPDAMVKRIIASNIENLLEKIKQ